MKLYHGTNNADKIGIRKPRSGNTVGFYLTNDFNVARQYGVEVLEFDVPNDTSIAFVVRNIGDTDDVEFVVTNQQDFRTLMHYEV